MFIKPQSRCWKRIGGIQSTEKYSRISCWPQHISINNLPLFKNNLKVTNLLRKLPTLVNWRNVVLLYDNARLYWAKIIQEKQLDSGCSVLPYLPYSLDFTPSDFYLFPSLQNAMNDKDQMKLFVESLLSLKPAKFYLRGINKLPDDWQEVIENKDEYNIDWNLFILNYSWINYILLKGNYF